MIPFMLHLRRTAASLLHAPLQDPSREALLELNVQLHRAGFHRVKSHLVELVELDTKGARVGHGAPFALAFIIGVLLASPVLPEDAPGPGNPTAADSRVIEPVDL